MNKGKDFFWLKSYTSHSDYDKSQNSNKIESWKHLDTVDAWRHKRMYDSLLPLIISCPSASWLTVGDGRYGTDANYLIRNGIKNVLATSLTDELLKLSKAEGFIFEYKVENAEQLSFESCSFDFVICKESYHHFPRPMIAFYEMLRVADKAVIIIEPNDLNLKINREEKSLVRPKNKIQLIKNFIKDFFGIKRYKYNAFIAPGYEPLGNYIYTTSEREFEKAALALDLPLIAFKGINDYYKEGVEFQKATVDSPIFNQVKNEINVMDDNCKKNKYSYNILVSIIFKTIPEESILDKLKQDGFRINHLSRNPYI